jgi:hypothetical protein
MNALPKMFFYSLVYLSSGIGIASAFNQTADLSPILSEAGVPFSVKIERASFALPVGVHSGAFGVYKGLWILIGGTHYGLHAFSGPTPFPPEAQNKIVYVVNPSSGSVSSRSLTDPGSGLTQRQIDTLSVIKPEFYQANATLYMAGGYGIDTASQTMSTKSVFTAINLDGLVEWVTNPGNSNQSVSNNIRQMEHPIFQVTGGEMLHLGDVINLVFGQNFTGVYNPGTSGVYSEQVRRFKIRDAGGQLSVDVLNSLPAVPDPNYRRRDLNILPALLNRNNLLEYGIVAYAGVFTLDDGVWTVPVVIDQQGAPSMADPNAASTFKQGMNQYVCASVNMYSRKYTSNYSLFFGGPSYGFYAGGVFQTDPEIPFINQVTAIQMDKNQHFTQYLMNGEYPIIPATSGSNVGNTLLFGTSAYFIPTSVLQYPNHVINLDNIRKPTVIGHIVGGIQSTVPNSAAADDTSASPYIFKVTLTPQN